MPTRKAAPKAAPQKSAVKKLAAKKPAVKKTAPKKAAVKKAAVKKAPALLPTRTINLALQGGGSHGAYTWGALEVLLDDPRIIIEGISGA